MTIDEALTRGVAKIIPSKDDLIKVMGKKKIRVYLGIDPTGPKLHLGHTIPLRKLQQFADLGHQAILVFGTGTVLAGDPSQRKEARKTITQAEIDENIKDWKKQAEKILDFSKIQIKYNGDWLTKLGYKEILSIASRISSIQLYKRDMFQERISHGDTVWTHETLYPLFQGYDSVHLDVDAEIGGTDQTFNMLIGRELQKKINSKEKFVITTPLISGTDGKPMSKTSENCIWLSDTPNEMYGKIMSLDDNLIDEYRTDLTDLPDEKLKPLEAKKKLAKEVVKLYHDETDATNAQKNFESTFQRGNLPQDISTIRVADSRLDLAEFLVANKLVSSKSEAKRLIGSGAIEIDEKTISNSKIELHDNQVMRVGKKQFVRIVRSK